MEETSSLLNPVARRVNPEHMPLAQHGRRHRREAGNVPEVSCRTERRQTRVTPWVPLDFCSIGVPGGRTPHCAKHPF